MYDADQSLRSDPPIHAIEGDDQIRTGGRWLSTPYTYVHRGREGFVYFIQALEHRASLIKIGFSGDPSERLRLIQRDVDDELVILTAFAAVQGEESALHQHFEKARVRGEWFRPEPELLDLIGEVAQFEWDSMEPAA